MNSLVDKYNEKRGKGSLNEDDCVALIVELANSYPLTTVIIDGLDECPKDVQSALLNYLGKIFDNVATNTMVKFFVSSRYERPIGLFFEKPGRRSTAYVIHMESQDYEEDINYYIRSRLDELIKEGNFESLAELPQLEERKADLSAAEEQDRLWMIKLRHDIITAMEQRAKGM